MTDQNTKALPIAEPTRNSQSDLQKIEAEWVTQELAESVKLIQQYRILYLTAVFLVFGWVMGQLIGAPGLQAPVQTLMRQRQRTDIAFVLCFIPLANVLYALLLLEMTAHVQTLARYRFVLGYALGNRSPAWRWEIWKSSKVGSVRAWTAPLNSFFATFLVILSAAALWFAHPAVRAAKSLSLQLLWLAAIVIPVSLLLVSAVTGWRSRKRNNVAVTPDEDEVWEGLLPFSSANKRKMDTNDQPPASQSAVAGERNPPQPE